MSPAAEKTILKKLEKLDHLEKDVHEVRQYLFMLSKTPGQTYEDAIRSQTDKELDTELKRFDW